MNNALQLCSFEQAKKLKEDGFDWFVNHFYDDSSTTVIGHVNKAENHNKNDGYYSCPTIQHTLMWYREVKNINAWIEKDCEIPCWNGYIELEDNDPMNAPTYADLVVKLKNSFEEVQFELLTEIQKRL